MFCGLEEERTRFRKKKQKNIAAKSGLVMVGMKGYLTTYNHVK